MDFIPERLETGVLYVSRRYRTASHLCCCGCGLEVVTPLNGAKWQVSERGGEVWLRPSVGNWSFPCQSHYWIDGGKVRWDGKISATAIATVRRRDQREAQRLVAKAGAPGPLRRFAGAVRAWVAATFHKRS